MIPVTELALFFIANAAAAEVGAGPAAVPGNGAVAASGVDPNTIILSWTNGDSTAYTRVYVDLVTNPATTEPDFVALPGATTWDTELPVSDPAHTFWLYHYKNGQLSAAGANTPVQWTA